MFGFLGRLIRVPLIIRHPDLPRGKLVEGYSQHVDLFPMQRMQRQDRGRAIAFSRSCPTRDAERGHVCTVAPPLKRPNRALRLPPKQGPCDCPENRSQQ